MCILKNKSPTLGWHIVVCSCGLGPGPSSWVVAGSEDFLLGHLVHKWSRVLPPLPLGALVSYHPDSSVSDTHLLLWCCSDGCCGSETGTSLSRPVASTGKEGSELPCGESGGLAGRDHTVVGSTVPPLYTSPKTKMDLVPRKRRTLPQSHPLRTRSRTVLSTSISSCCCCGCWLKCFMVSKGEEEVAFSSSLGLDTSCWI